MGAQTLSGGMAIDERLDLADDLGVTAGLEVRVDALLDRRKPLLLQPCDLAVGRTARIRSRPAARRARGRVLPASRRALFRGLRHSPGRGDQVDERASRSTCSGRDASAYPGGFVTSTSAPSVFRSCEMKFWSDVPPCGAAALPTASRSDGQSTLLSVPRGEGARVPRAASARRVGACPSHRRPQVVRGSESQACEVCNTVLSF